MAKILSEKLMLAKVKNAVLLNAPKHFQGLLGELPPTLKISTSLSAAGHPDFVLAFVTHMAEVGTQLEALKPYLKGGEYVWLAYPKGGSKVPTDLKRDPLHAKAKEYGFEGVTLIALDEDWSAFRLKW